MKQKCFLLLILLGVFLAYFVGYGQNGVAYAEEKTLEEQLEETTDQNLDSLDTSDFQTFLDELSEEEKSLSFSTAVKAFIKGLTEGEIDELNFASYLSSLSKFGLKCFIGFLPALISIFIISLFGSIVSGLSSDFLKKETSEVIYYVCYAAVIVVLLTAITPSITAAKATVAKTARFAEIIFPLLLTLTTALGGNATSAVYQPLVAIFSVGIIKLITTIIIPLFLASLVFCIVGNLSKSIKLTKLTSAVNSIAEWLIGIVFSLFTTFVAIKGIIGMTADKVSVNSAKFALKSYVPILGGYLSDGFDLVVASLVVIKNALGVTGIVVLLSIVLLPTLKLVALSLCLRLTAGLSEPLGDGRISDLLSSVAKCLNVLIATMLGLGFVFLLLLMMIIISCNFGMM